MTKTAQQVQRVAEESFLDENFGQLDLSSFPHLQPPAKEEENERFAPLSNDRPMRLRKEINRMVNEYSNDPEIVGTLKAAGVENLAAPHKFYLSTGDEAVVFLGKDNVWRVTVFFDGRQQTIKCASATSRDDAMTGANKWLNSKRGPTFKELTEEQRLTVSRMCTQGQLESALMTYLLYKCGEVDHDFSTDPRYLPAIDEAAFFIFHNATPEFVDSQEFQDFLSNFRGDRPLSLPLLRACFSAWKQHEQKAERGLILEQIENRDNQADSEGPSYEELDALPDDELFSLRDATLKDRAKKVRGGILQ